MKARGVAILPLLLVITHLSAQQNLIAPAALFRLAKAPKALAEVPPDLEWSPPQTTLGYFEAGAETTASFSLKNPGGKPLLITKISCSCPQISASDQQIQIEPGETVQIEVLVKPSEADAFRCYLTLYANTPDWIHVIPLEGIAYHSD